MSEWKECRLVDVAVFQRGHDLPKKDMKEGTIPVAGSNGIIGYHNTATTKCPGVTIGRSGNIGTPKFYNGDFWAHNTVLYVKDFKGNDEKFVFYFLHIFDFSGFNAGSAVPTLNRNHIHEIPVVFPPLPEQRAIAGVLSSLDDKIGLLHRQNKTLESIAETLFRRWFIEERNNSTTAYLKDYVNCINGVSYKSSELNPSKTALVTLKSFNRHGGFSINGFKEFIGKHKEQQIVLEGDLIVAHTDITQEAEVLGNPALIISSPIYDTLVISMDLVKVVPKIDWVSNEFLYFLMRSREFKHHCLGCANGTTVLHLNKEAIPTFELSIPDKRKVIEFTKFTKDLIQQVFIKHRQIRTLSCLRDTLLPRLMSGEVRVKI